MLGINMIFSVFLENVPTSPNPLYIHHKRVYCTCVNEVRLHPWNLCPKIITTFIWCTNNTKRNISATLFNCKVQGHRDELIIPTKAHSFVVGRGWNCSTLIESVGCCYRSDDFCSDEYNRKGNYSINTKCTVFEYKYKIMFHTIS